MNRTDGYAHGNTIEETRYVGASGGKGGPFQQLCCSLCISLVGFLFFVGSLVLIGNNEISSVCVSRALNSAGAQAETINCSGDRADQYTGEVVHAACKISEDSLRAISPRDFAGADGLYGAFSVKALKVRQEVSVYQCKERKETRTEGEGDRKREITTYKYTQAWSDSHIESNNFKGWENQQYRRAMEDGCGYGYDGNPYPALQTTEFVSEKLIAGVYDLSHHRDKVFASRTIQIKRQNNPYTLPSKVSGLKPGANVQARSWDDKWYDATIVEQRDGGMYMVEWANGDTRNLKKAKKDLYLLDKASLQQSGSALYTCDPGRPAIGCTRVEYKESTATSASFISKLGRKEGSYYVTRSWHAPASWMCDSGGASNRVDLFAEGISDPDEMVSTALAANSASMWVVRGLGVFLSVLGIMMFLHPIQTVANLVDQFFDWFKFIPLFGSLLDFLGNVVSGAVGCAIFMISLGIGLPSSLLVLSLTWCLMRPLIGVPMVMACVAVFAYTVKQMYEYATIGRQNRAATAKAKKVT